MTRTITAIALGLSFIFAAGAIAQDQQLQAQSQQTRQFQVQQQSGQQRILPQVNPQYPQPKLGIWGHMDYRGMVVDSVAPNSPAAKLGLESGDVVVRINGQRVDSIFTYQTLLRDAVNYKHGHVSVLVENIRWHSGQSFEKYVTSTTHLPNPQYGIYGGGSSEHDHDNDHGSHGQGSFGG